MFFLVSFVHNAVSVRAVLVTFVSILVICLVRLLQVHLHIFKNSYVACVPVKTAKVHVITEGHVFSNRACGIAEKDLTH
jgi:hypothetical protein